MSLEPVSGRSHNVTCTGCIVSLTTPTRSSLKASRSVSSRSVAENASSVFAASYLLRKKRRSMNDWVPPSQWVEQSGDHERRGHYRKGGLFAHEGDEEPL